MPSAKTSLFSGLFLGEYDHALDAQCRVSLPSDWRSRDGETELVMIPARGKALVLLPIATFLEFVEKAKKLAIANPKMQMAFAYLGSRSRQCRCDKQGRIALEADRRLDPYPADGAGKLGDAERRRESEYVSGRDPESERRQQRHRRIARRHPRESVTGIWKRHLNTYRYSGGRCLSI